MSDFCDSIDTDKRKQNVALKVVLSKLNECEVVDPSDSEVSSLRTSPLPSPPASPCSKSDFALDSRTSSAPSSTMKPTELVGKLLANTTNLDVVKELVAEHATYVSLNYNDPDLQKIEPWCGIHEKEGPEGVYQTFVDVGRYWEVLKFETYAVFGDGEDVAVFGRFQYKSRTLGKITDSPFAIWCKVDQNAGKVTYMQFMEDTLSTAASFRKSGQMIYESDPDGEVGEFAVKADDPASVTEEEFLSRMFKK